MYSQRTAFIDDLNGARHDAFQRLVDIHHQNIAFVGTRLLQRFKLRHQHLGFEEMTFARFQTAFNDVEITFQVDKGEVRVSLAQQVAIVFFSAEQTISEILLVRCIAKAASFSACNHGLRSSSFNGSPEAIFQYCSADAENRRPETRHEADAPRRLRQRIYRCLIRPSERKRGDHD